MGSGTLTRVWRYARWLLLIALILVVALTSLGYVDLNNKRKTADAVAYIESRHITRNDVDGKHLPPPPDPRHKDSTVQGIDVNQNGIRDDVELAIFAKYPDSPYTRAAELQYAMALQLTLTNVVDSETWKAAAIQEDRAFQCLGESVPRIDLNGHNQILTLRAKEVEALVFNTSGRTREQELADAFTTSYSLPNNNYCDVNIADL